MLGLCRPLKLNLSIVFSQFEPASISDLPDFLQIAVGECDKIVELQSWSVADIGVLLAAAGKFIAL